MSAPYDPNDPNNPGNPPGGYGAAPPPPPPGSYGAPAGPGGYAPPPGFGPPYAEWISRVAAAVIDGVCILPIYIVGIILAAVLGHVSNALGGIVLLLTYLGAIGFVIWNLVRQGQSGQTIGKGVMKIKLVADATGQPVGAGLSIGRAIVHVIDSLPCYIGYLWPLWDQKKQTFADKVLNTIVIQAPV